MAILVEGVVFVLGNPVARVGETSLDVQEMQMGGGGVGCKTLAFHQELRWLICSTLHLKYIAFSGRLVQANFLTLCPVIIFCKSVTYPDKQNNTLCGKIASTKCHHL